jgi:TRAP-type C4-dicarboxylate transport system permease large subunit
VQISVRSAFAILAPAILLGGIYGSLFMPTGPVGTVGIYVLMLSLFILTCPHDTVLRLPGLAGYQG